MDKSGLVCGSVCACLGPDRDLRGTKEQQKTGLDYMKRLLDQMVVLGCPSLIGPVYSSVGRADAVPADEYKRQWGSIDRPYYFVTRMIGDQTRIKALGADGLRRHYPWHYVAPFGIFETRFEQKRFWKG